MSRVFDIAKFLSICYVLSKGNDFSTTTTNNGHFSQRGAVMWKNEELEGLQRYIREFDRYPRIKDPAKIAELVKRWQKQKDQNTRDQLVYSNSRLVLRVALKYRNRGVPLEDLFQDGMMGLMRALEDYDPKKGSLSTYATWWIKGFICRTIPGTNTRRPYRLTDQAHKMIGLVAKTINRFYNKYGRWPDNEEICSSIHANGGETKVAKNITLQQVELCTRLLYEKYISLNSPVVCNGNDNPYLVEDVVADTKDLLDEIVGKRLDLKKIMASVQTIDPRTRTILHLRFQDEVTLGQIGKIFGLSRERIRQIEESGLEKIRQKLKLCLNG